MSTSTTPPETTIPTTSPPKQLLLLTHPRSASNLLIKILNLPSQPNLVARQHGGYYFFPAWMMQTEELQLHLKPLAKWTPAERLKVLEKYQTCADELVQESEDAVMRGKTMFVKEHTCFFLEPASMDAMQPHPQIKECDDELAEEPWTVKVPEKYGSLLTHHRLNMSPMPDAYLREWHPTFLIRHPALAFTSYRRVTRAPNDKLAAQMTLRYTRAMYEWWDAEFRRLHEAAGAAGDEATTKGDEQWPVILDADDIITNPAVLEHWCEITGGAVDVSRLQYEWAPLTAQEKEDLSFVARRMTVTLQESGGIVKQGKTAGELGLIGEGKEEALDREVERWKEEFGGEDAGVLEGWVKGAVQDYEWLRERRLRVD